MTAAPKIDVRDLKSVRAAARGPDLVLGEDWVEEVGGDAENIRRGRFATLRHSPIARKIVTFNLIALILLIAGVLYLSPSRDSLAFQRAKGLVNEAQLIADVFEARLPSIAPIDLVSGDGIDPEATLAALDLRGGVEVTVFSTDAVFVTSATGMLSEGEAADLEQQTGGTFLIDFFSGLFFQIIFGKIAEQR